MTKKRVCLLFPKFFEGFILRKVPLGLAYLSGALADRGIPVEAYNLNVDPLEEIDFKRFDVIGITLLTPFIDEVNRICRHVREQNPALTIAVGGPHATHATRNVFVQCPEVDYAIAGEGEIAFPELILHEALRDQIPGVYRRLGPSGSVGTPRQMVDIHSLPYPNQRIFDHGRLEKLNPFRAIMASRGCPFKCANCQPILNEVQPFRLRTPSAVVDEMEYLQLKYGQTYFGFVDSEFPIRKSWLLEFYELIRDRGIEVQMHCNARSDLLDRDILRILKSLAITRLAIGVESGVQRVIDSVLHKNIDLARTLEVFEEAREEGVRTHGHFMIGIPGETLDDMEQTLQYAVELPASSIEFNMLTPWPGTKFWDICVSRGYLETTNSALFNEKRGSHISTEDFSNRQVEAFYQEIRRSLLMAGWINSVDGSVYFHPQISTEVDRRVAS